MSIMGFLTKLKNLFKKKEDITRERIALIEDMKDLYPNLEYSVKENSILLLFNGYPIADVYDNLFVKQSNWESLATDMEINQIKLIYKKLDEICNE